MRDIWGFSGNPDGQPLGGLERIEQGKRKKLRIEGGTPLSGTLTIDDIRGTKNMFPTLFLAACLKTVQAFSVMYQISPREQ